MEQLKRMLFAHGFGLALFFGLNGSEVQAQLFRGGIVVGSNFSQIEGDDISGFRKIGLLVGVSSEILLSEQFFLNFDILYSQKGSRGTFEGDGSFLDKRIALDYLEIPVLFKYRDSKGMDFGGGLSLGRLVRNEMFENGIDSTEPYFTEAGLRNFDLGLVGDVTYNASDRWQIGFRWTYALWASHFKASANRGRVTGLFNNAISLRLVLMFGAQPERSNL